jgi:hypothetical protein
MSTRVASAIIVASASLSGAVDVRDAEAMSIEIPSAWTAANLTFQGCHTVDGTFVDLYDDSGAEITVTVGGASRLIAVDYQAAPLRNVNFLKVRSGTTASAVAQAAARTLRLHLGG